MILRNINAIESKLKQDSSGSATKSYRSTIHLHVLASFMSSACSRALSQPFDVIKMHLIFYRRKKVIAPLEVQPHPLRLLNQSRLRYALRHIYKTRGIKGFWAGTTVGQWQGFGHDFIQFWGYGYTHDKLIATPVATHENILEFMSGFTAGLFSVTLFAPFDLVRTRLMLPGRPIQPKSSLETLLHIGRKEGLPGLYRGTMSGILQVAPLLGSRFLIYNLVCHKAVENTPGAENKFDLPEAALFLAGAISGLFSTLLTYPLDVARKRIQAYGLIVPTANPSDARVLKIGICFRRIYQKYGIRGFYIGLLPATVKSTISTAICISSYDMFYNVLQKNL